MGSRPLKIYKASAGSGKTFTLAVEYIKLLIQNPMNYRHILAVTFTNKATAEMKQRILSQLYGIGAGLSESNDYLRTVMEDADVVSLGLDERQVRERARTALSCMMHDFSRFRIETIDSFFQGVIRELAHELNLTANLRVDLNDEEVLDEAVNAIIDELPQNKMLFDSVFTFIKEKINEGKNWNINQEVKKFGQNIFNEQYLEHGQDVREKIGDVTTLRHYKQSLTQLEDDEKQKIKAMGAEFDDACHRAGIEAEDLSRRSGSPRFFFEKLSHGEIPNAQSATLQQACSDATVWVNKGNNRLIPSIEQYLVPCLNKAVEALPLIVRTLNTIDVTRKHLNHLTLINAINSMVRDLNDEANRFLLADTAHFLSELIEGSDIPFIYERTGSQFHYIMIDEFQDTSALQWRNFKPLLQNSLAENHECLLVGDVKQSIYRWRNSDWGILNNIEDGTFAGKITPLRSHVNYRSSEAVVNFNNYFFEHASHHLNHLYRDMTESDSDDILRAYDTQELMQETKPGKRGMGYVRVECIEHTGDVNDLNQLQLERLSDAVRMLIDAHVDVDDIAILIRRKKDLQSITRHFTEVTQRKFPSNIRNRIHIVSAEAFRLDSSPAVCLLIQAMRVLADPDDRLARYQLAFQYQNHITAAPEAETDADGEPDDINRIFLLTDDALGTVLPEAFCNHSTELATMPLFKLAEELHQIFQLEHIPHQDAYLFTFFDQLSEYLKDEPSDIDSFLDYWDKTLCSVTIPSTSACGIRALTIHKSKGLEFKNVIVPFCNWSLDGKDDDLLWCEPKQPPFNQLPLVPVNYTSKTEQSFFSTEYREEKLKNFVDNLNLLYVAFTRAEDNLIIITGQDISPQTGSSRQNSPAITSRNCNANMLIRLALQDLPQTDTDEGSMKLHIYESGTIVPSSTKTLKPTDNVLLRRPEPIHIQFEGHEAHVQFLQSNQSAEFIRNDDWSSDAAVAEKTTYLNEGVLFHHLMAEIQQPADIDKAIRKFDSAGFFPNTVYRTHIDRLIKKAFAKKEAARWFDPHWQVINESTILYKDQQNQLQQCRPDRVITDGDETIVIDYKTGRQSTEYEMQVRTYMQYLRQMGYPNVSGYIWYVRREDIVPVT